MSKKILALLLVMTLLLGLCACGKEAEDTSAAPAESGAAETGDSPAEKVPGYISQVIELPEGCTSVQTITIAGDRLLALCTSTEEDKLCALDLGSDSWSWCFRTVRT